MKFIGLYVSEEQVFDIDTIQLKTLTSYVMKFTETRDIVAIATVIQC